jgi:uncharacterized protein DUF3455
MAHMTVRGTTRITALALLLLAFGAPVVADSGYENRAPDVGEYTNLNVPEGHKVAFRAYAEGVQIYRWNGAMWSLVGPEAYLYDQDDEVIGIHYAGPTWESASGSKVVGRVLERATPDPDSIQWLKLEAVASEGPGIFRGVTYIQRVYTVGGKAPSDEGYPGEVVRVPYATDYYFYKKQ